MKAYTVPERLPRYGALATILREIAPGQEILDVGCSSGYLAAHLDGRNSVWGIDGNPDAVERARRWCVEVRQIDLNTLPDQSLFERRFDVIVLADILEHLLDPARTLRHFAQYLKPSGRVLVSLPNVGLWRVRLGLLFGSFNYAEYGVLDSTHLHFYTFATGKRIVEEAGLCVVRTQGAANELGVVARFIYPLRNLASINMVFIAVRDSVRSPIGSNMTPIAR